jgi:alpha-tubulin suppressor-like RCC1 family protein
VFVGGSAVCALTATQTLCWGQSRETGTGVDVGRTAAPTAQASPVTGATEVAGNGYVACAWEPGGSRRCWGTNSEALLGNGTMTDALVPATVSDGIAVRGMSFGAAHACAVATDGGVWCWGARPRVMGVSDAMPSLSPVRVPGVSDIAQVSLGWNGTCALDSAGTVWCWGLNTAGELGRVTTTGDDPTPAPVVGLPGPVAELGSNSASSCARIRATGEVWCWGRGTLGDAARPGTAMSNVPLRVPGLSGVRRLFAGVDRYCVLFEGADLRCWGLDAGIAVDPYAPAPAPVPVRW